MAVLAMTTAIYGSFVVSREDADRAPIEGMRQGLDLLAIERDVSVVAFDFVAALKMHMYDGEHAAEMAGRYGRLGDAIRDAADALDSLVPTPGWARTHRGMSDAVDAALASWDEPRTPGETRSWLSEFLYDFKLVIPTDNMGEWSALLESATWSQEVPLVIQDYLDLGMAREWQLTGRQPSDPDLLDSYNVSLASARQLRESHGDDAGEYTPFEEYILGDLAAEADSTTAALVDAVARHPGVREMESAMPFLLGSTSDEPRGLDRGDLPGPRRVGAGAGGSGRAAAGACRGPPGSGDRGLGGAVACGPVRGAPRRHPGGRLRRPVDPPATPRR